MSGAEISQPHAPAWVPTLAQIDARIEELADFYEYRGDGGDYTPSDQERALLIDYCHGLLADEELLAMLRAHFAVAGLQPLLDRIEWALQRHLDGHSPRRLPIDTGDSDLVLEDLRSLRRGEPLRFAQLEADTNRTAYVDAYRVRGQHHVVLSAVMVPIEAPVAVVNRLVRTRSGTGEDYMLPAEAQHLWAELLQLANAAGDTRLEQVLEGDGSGRALPPLEDATAGAEREAIGCIEIDCPACGIDYDYPDIDGIPAWPRLCPCGHVYSRSELREFGVHHAPNGEPSGLQPPTTDQAIALEAARSLRSGQPLGACPQGVILELLQLLQLEAAERKAECPRCTRPRHQHVPNTPAKRARLDRLRTAEAERERREALTTLPHPAASPG